MSEVTQTVATASGKGSLKAYIFSKLNMSAGEGMRLKFAGTAGKCLPEYMCPGKTSTLVQGLSQPADRHPLLPASKAATWKDVRRRQRMSPLHPHWRQLFPSAVDGSKSLNWFS